MDLKPLACSFDEESRTLFVSGSVDELSGVVLRENLAKYSDDYQENLTVDLARVDFLPSLGIGVLAVAMRDAETNGAVIDLVVEAGTLAHQVLNVCGLPYRER